MHVCVCVCLCVHLFLLKVAVLSHTVPVDPSCRYPAEEVTCIQRWSGTFELCGGVNLPRIINCCGTGEWSEWSVSGVSGVS